MTPAQEAAAMHGLAENANLPGYDRLAAALKALEFYTSPHRGDQVEAWIKTFRDEWPQHHREWHGLDKLLDDYRLHADTGTPLDEDVTDGPGEPQENGTPG